MYSSKRKLLVNYHKIILFSSDKYSKKNGIFIPLTHFMVSSPINNGSGNMMKPPEFFVVI